MIAYNLNNIDRAKELVELSEKYSNYFPVDVRQKHYIVDGKSILGVMSMIGNVVEVIPVMPNIIDEITKQKHFQFIQDIQKLGRD